MKDKRILKCQINCQKGKRMDAEFSMESGMYETESVRIELTEKITD